MNIGIIGGTDGLGKSIANYLKDEFDVYITGRNHEKGKSTAKELDVKYIESNKTLANSSDILIIAVPIQHTSHVIREVAQFMKEHSVMIDVTSIKEEPAKVMSEILPDNVEYIPAHPVFGPRIAKPDYQTVVLTPDRKGKWYYKVYTYLNNRNMKIIESSAEEHDFMMSVVQILTHFSFMTTAYTLEKLNADLKEIDAYKSPMYDLMIDMIALVLSQTADLTYSIQTMNKNGEYIRNTFFDAVYELKEVFNNGDNEAFTDILMKTKNKIPDIKQALKRSDKAINCLNHEFNYLTDNIGKEIALKDTCTEKIHRGILESLEGNIATISECDNLEKLQINNIRILTHDELQILNSENQDKVDYITCVFSENADAIIIQNTVKSMDNILDVVLVNKESCLESDKIILTFKIISSDNSIENVKELFTGFGGMIK